MVSAPYGSQISVIPQVFGWLNICISVLVLACSICSGGYLMIMMQAMPQIKAQQQQAQGRIQEMRDEQVADLEAQAEAAETDEERAQLRARAQEVQARLEFTPPDVEKMLSFVNDRGVLAYYAADLISALVLNIGLLVAGIGLLFRKNWARVASLVIAGIKIVRHAILLVAWLVFAVPVMARSFTDFFEQAMADAARNGAGGPPPPPGTMLTAYSTMLIVWGVSVAVVGVIYPLLSLWFLSRERARLACTMPSQSLQQDHYPERFGG